jgi:hypothetical protein
MVIVMQSLSKHFAEFARALRNFRYERTESGVFFPQSGVSAGGVFSHSVDGGPWTLDKNTVTLQVLDDILSAYFTASGVPSAFYVAPFTNNVAPTSSLTASTFASTQGEYTSYTQSARVQWVANGASSGQSVSNSVAPAAFTIGSSSATVAGAGLLTTSTKGATTGILVAAALFGTANTLSPGSTLSVQYTLSATAS